jgi:hypothetical protein
LGVSWSCLGDGITTYRIEKTPSAAKGGEAASPAKGDAGGKSEIRGPGASLQWKAPVAWDAAPPGGIRLLSFKATGKNGKTADVSVIPLPGMAGTDLDNVNRWRGQIGLPPVPLEELGHLSTPVTISGQMTLLYEFAGTPPEAQGKSRILAAVLRREGTAWFFKMTGDDDLVAGEKAHFVEFLRSMNFTAGENATAELPPNHPVTGGLPSAHPPVGNLPAAHPPIGNVPGPAANSAPAEQNHPKWNVPGSWKEVSGGQFLVAKFLIAGTGDSHAAVNVSTSAGDGGGLSGNINRWRGQLGLDQLGAREVEQLAKPFPVPDGKAKLVELSGSDPRTGNKTRLVAFIVSRKGETWFYKLMGDEPLVKQEQEHLARMVNSAAY